MRRAATTYTDHTHQLLALLRHIARSKKSNPRTMAAALDISQPTVYRMLIELREAFKVRIDWDAAVLTYRVRDWGIIKRLTFTEKQNSDEIINAAKERK